MGAVEGYKPDRLGGLEIVKWHTGGYAIRVVGAEWPVTTALVLPHKRIAVAMRKLLIDAAGYDWTSMPRGADRKLAPEPDVRARVLRLHDLADDECRRRIWGVCLLCGHALDPCACGRAARADDPRRWTAEDMAWAL